MAHLGHHTAVIESFTSNEEDGLTPFLILDVLEAKIFWYIILEGHIVWKKCPFWQQKQNFYEMLVALATVSVTISSPESRYFNQELWQVSFVLNELKCL